MLDLRAISRDPEPALAALARRKDGSDERLRAALAARERLNAIRPELQAAQAERNAGAKAIGEAKRTGADATRGDRRDAGGQRARQGARARGDAPRGGAPPARDDAAEPARPVRRRRGHRPQRVGLVRSRRQGPPRAGRRDDRHGGGLAGRRARASPTSRATSCSWSWRSCAGRWRSCAGTGSSPSSRRCWSRKRRCSARASCPTPSSRSTAWPTIRSTSPARPRCRSRRCTRARSWTRCRAATPASRPASGVRRAPRARTRAASSASTSSTRSRCSRSWSRRTPLAEHERLLAIEEEIWQGLEIPYRVVNIAVDDLGNSAVKKYDIEAWLPSQQRFREVTSTSNTTDFQSRRLDIRYRPDGGKPTHVHTLNGTAVAVEPRADRADGEPSDRRRRGRDPAGPAGVGRPCAPGLTSRARSTSATSAGCPSRAEASPHRACSSGPTTCRD